MTRLILTLSLGLLTVCVASPAFAGKPLSTAAKERAAKKACAMGDYAKGVELLADLYVDTNDPLWVYNQGRCYQQNNRWEQAISRFREYLRKAQGISESDRAETEHQIADCEQSMGKPTQVAAPVAPAPAPVAALPAPVVTPEEPKPQPADVVTVPNKPESRPDSSPGKGLRVAGIVAAVVGGGAVGTGVALALKANGLSTTDYSRSREDQRASLKTWSTVGYGVGAAAIVTGVVLYIVG